MRHLELRSGATARLLVVQQLLALLAAVNLLSVPVAGDWLAAALLALLAANIAGSVYLLRSQPAGRLVLRDDGTLSLRQGCTERAGTLLPAAWVNRWLCVLRWKPLEARTARACLVCSWTNRFDDYRRLLVRLRLGAENR